MRISVPGLVLAIVLYAIEFIGFTFFIAGSFQSIQSYHLMLNYTRDFVDEVIDTRQVTDEMMEDFSLQLASAPIVYSAEIYRYVKVVNPDPINPGQTVTNWVIVDDYSTFNTGDRVQVVCKPLTVGPYEAIANGIMHLPADNTKIVKTGRIR